MGRLLWLGDRSMCGADLCGVGESSGLRIARFGSLLVRSQQIGQGAEGGLFVGIVELDVTSGREHHRTLPTGPLARRRSGLVAGMTETRGIGGHGLSTTGGDAGQT